MNSLLSWLQVKRYGAKAKLTYSGFEEASRPFEKGEKRLSKGSALSLIVDTPVALQFVASQLDLFSCLGELSCGRIREGASGTTSAIFQRSAPRKTMQQDVRNSLRRPSRPATSSIATACRTRW